MLKQATLLIAGLAACALAQAADYPFQPVPFTSVRITGGFWQQKQETNRKVTLPFAMQQCEESGRLKNFDLAAEVMRRRAAGEKDFQITPPTIYPFDDTDAYKSIEGASYMLSMQKDPALEATLDGWIARIAAAQEADGYLYTFRTMHPDTPGHKWVHQSRWLLDPELSHELYNAGHLYEAGVAHFRATGKRTLLDICLRNAELLWKDFGDRKLRIAPGHQIVEMGLVKLYGVTQDKRWLELAQIFLEARGPTGPEYSQRHRPVVEQDEAVGHAVRANYMYSGMADVAALTGDTRYLNAIGKIWENVVSRKLYLTGGTGALARGEAYGANYELPHDGYNETCAALAFMNWNHRMFLFTGESKYMDVFERTAFNGFISGVSHSGDRFFYPNPLSYDGKARNNHEHAGRAPWFGCACCPPNLMRTLAALSGSFYAVRGKDLYVNFYAQSEGRASVGGTEVGLTQDTAYPWKGYTRLALTLAAPATFTLHLRIPGWAQGVPVPSDLYSYEAPTDCSWKIRVNGRRVETALEKGYVVVAREWQHGDKVEIDFAMPVQVVHGNDRIAATQGQVAYERGPIVYCVESINGSPDLSKLGIPPRAGITTKFQPDLLGGVTTLRLMEGVEAIPYFAWNNRGLNPMTVWIK
jgi:DUF1680 family protein